MPRAFTREMLVWSNLKEHPGIAKFLGFYADFKRSEAWLLSPWEPNGNVSEFIKARNLEVPEKLSLVYDTIDALAFLHQLDPPVCHGDIKSANVLVTAEYKARLCDFGLARLHEDSGFGRLETSTGMKGSIRWCSPEVLNGAQRGPASDVPEVLNGAQRGPASDVYSWAWLVWEIMTGTVPYEDATVDFVIMRQIFESPLPQVDGQSRLSDCLQVWELMTRCWNFDPLQRPTASMCKTTITYLPRCTPTATTPEHQTRSAALLENLGDLEGWKGNPEKSSAYLDEALQLYREQADSKGMASVLRKQTVAAYRLSDYVRLRTIATTALDACRALNDPLGVAESSYYLGHSVYMLAKRADVDEVLPILRQSLEIRRAHGDDVGAVQCLERIGEIQRFTGKKNEALSTLDEAMAIASRSGDRLGLASALNMVGFTHFELSNFDNAADALSEATMISRNIGWEGGLANILRNMSRLKMQLGDYVQATELLKESVSISRHIRNQRKLARSLEELGECFKRQSKLAEAVPVLEQACRLWHELSEQKTSKSIASTLVRLKSTQGDWNGVLFWHDHIITVCRSQKDHLEEGKCLIEKGKILLKLQRHDEAALHFEAAIATCRERGYSWPKGLAKLCAIPKTTMKWERRLRLLCDVRKLQRRLPQLVTARLKLPLVDDHGRR
ncbi:hypothetical protein FRC01_014715 [Tulasnella sp. 417]|nr:hypothetical protein FRC01_014715 [Tulasnella sp. 417]